ncbi:MFS transporter [Pseudonocardia kunmingensis]|uniref:Cyanate permease n=1 Tax=Pseudonocardia kunmingensis TaxID=630975 RepID=A0A543DQN2_9PSEU|nr:MFS transporter [Pseudonocardia kunmingensis]TQM11640.1 cyanate permease [Pseudonocardia kunmingensis]
MSRSGKRAPAWTDARVTTAGSLAMCLSAPGQTAAVSVFVDPMAAELGVGRTAVSTAYLIGTLAGAVALPLIGRAMDRRGARPVLLVIGAVFGAVLVGLSAVSGLVGLTAGFVGIRFAGQGALTLVATTLVAYHVQRRLGTAIGVVTAIGSAGISLAPIGLEALIAEHGFRTAWLVQGVAVWVLIVPIALLGVPRRSRAPVPAAPRATRKPKAVRSAGVARQVLRVPMFWVLSGGVGVLALVGTALTFHQVDVLGERGLTSVEAAATFLPQTVSGLASTLLIGVVLDRVSPRPVMVGAMLMLVAALVLGGFLPPGWWGGALYGIALGVANNSFRTVEAAALPRYFGTETIGEIRGIVHMVTVAASAVGPVLLALGHAAVGTYRPLLLVLIVLPVGLLVGILLVREPGPRRTEPLPTPGSTAPETPPRRGEERR